MRIALLALSFLLIGLLPAHAVDYLTVKESKHSVKVTVNRLEKVLLSKGIKIMGRVDHAAGAKEAGLELPETQLLIFGNPKLGTPLMKADPQIGAVLPLKILVWTAENGKVFMGYVPPSTLKDHFKIEGQDAIFEKMTNALDGVTTQAAAAD